MLERSACFISQTSSFLLRDCYVAWHEFYFCETQGVSREVLENKLEGKDPTRSYVHSPSLSEVFA